MQKRTQMPEAPKLKNAWLQNMVESLAVSFQSSETRQWLQVFFVDPVVAYIMERCIPYFIIAAIIVIGMFLLVICTFYLVFRSSRHIHCPHCG
jgi:hypothetical protein